MREHLNEQMQSPKYPILFGKSNLLSQAGSKVLIKAMVQDIPNQAMLYMFSYVQQILQYTKLLCYKILVVRTREIQNPLA